MAFLHNTSSFLFCFFSFQTPKEPRFVSSKPTGVCALLSSLLYRVRSLVNRKWIPPIKYSLLLRQSTEDCSFARRSLQKGQCWVSLVTEYPQSTAATPGFPHVVCSSRIWFPLWWFRGFCIWIWKPSSTFSPDILKGTTWTPYWWYLKAGWKKSSISWLRL